MCLKLTAFAGGGRGEYSFNLRYFDWTVSLVVSLDSYLVLVLVVNSISVISVVNIYFLYYRLLNLDSFVLLRYAYLFIMTLINLYSLKSFLSTSSI